MSHSKRNTSRAVFTSHERSLAKAAWTVSSARLSRDSFLPLGACCLCLSAPATDPVACPAGDIFCRECALSNILAQKQEQRRRDKLRAQAARDEAARLAREDAEAQAHAVRAFELAQAGLGSGGGGGGGGGDSSGGRAGPRHGGSSSSSSSDKREDSRPTPDRPQNELPALPPPPGQPTTTTASPPPSKKRKLSFSLDADELARVADADRARARRAIEAERAAAAEGRALPSFWAPSATPSSNRGVVGGRKDAAAAAGPDDDGHDAAGSSAGNGGSGGGGIVCPAAPAAEPHLFSLHTLVTIHFAVDDTTAASSSSSSSSLPARICPACRKPLTNASKAVLAKPCGHVLCRSCVHQFVKPPDTAALFDPHAPPGRTGHVRCYVCEADLEEDAAADAGAGADKKSKRDAKKHKKHKERITPGLVPLRSEGTGFSAGGAREVKKDGVAFQC